MIRIRINKSEVWIRGSGSVPKFHGSATVYLTFSVGILEYKAAQFPHIFRLEDVAVSLHAAHSVEWLETLRASRIEVLQPDMINRILNETPSVC